MSSKVVIISNSNELVRVRPERIVYIESDGNYSTMVLHDKMEHMFTMNLAHCQYINGTVLLIYGYYMNRKLM